VAELGRYTRIEIDILNNLSPLNNLYFCSRSRLGPILSCNCL